MGIKLNVTHQMLDDRHACGKRGRPGGQCFSVTYESATLPVSQQEQQPQWQHASVADCKRRIIVCCPKLGLKREPRALRDAVPPTLCTSRVNRDTVKCVCTARDVTIVAKSATAHHLAKSVPKT